MRQFVFSFIALTASGCAVQPASLDTDSPANAYAIATAEGSNAIVSITSKPWDVPHSKPEIITRAQGCAGRVLTFSSVSARGSSATLFGNSNTSVSVGGGQLIEVSDPAGGILVANHRVSYYSALIPYSAQARVTVEAKDGRFRIVLTNPERLQRSTGYAPTDDFSPMHRVWGTGWQEGVEQLTAAAEKLATCIQSPAEDW